VSQSLSMPQGVPQGGLPPGLGAPPANLGGVTIPQSNPGNIKGALEKLHAAAKLINDAIPQIPLGTPLHTEVLKIATNLNKHLGEAKEEAQGTIQTMLQAIQQMRQQPNMAALHQGGPPQQPPAAPAMAA
jgi:hypothetical protein